MSYAPETRVSARYGAPMGRGVSEDLLRGRVSLRHVRLDSGGYDSGGAYWGHGIPLYYAEGAESGYVYVRAMSRDYAKAILLELGHTSPETKYYR